MTDREYACEIVPHTGYPLTDLRLQVRAAMEALPPLLPSHRLAAPPEIRAEIHPRLYREIMTDPATCWQYGRSPGPVTGGLLPVPAIVTADGVPDGGWRLVQRTVLGEGRILPG